MPSLSFQFTTKMYSGKVCRALDKGHSRPCSCFASVSTGRCPALGESPSSEEIPLSFAAFTQPLQANVLQSMKLLYPRTSLSPLPLGFYPQRATSSHRGRSAVPRGISFSPLRWHQLQGSRPTRAVQAERLHTAAAHLVIPIHFARPRTILESVFKGRLVSSFLSYDPFKPSREESSGGTALPEST